MSDQQKPVVRRILGIDPGTILTGFGVIEVINRSIELIDYGCVRPPPKDKLSDRYLIIFNAIETLISRYQPTELSIETQFVHRNVQTAIKLGMARGVVLLQKNTD